MTYAVVRVGILCQEQFQNALRECLDFRDICYTRTRDRCEAMRIPTNIDTDTDIDTDTYCINDG